MIPRKSRYPAAILLLAASFSTLYAQSSPPPAITTLAGNGTAAFSGDGGDSLNASLSFPLTVSVDKDGNLLVADTGNNRIRRIIRDATSMISTVAGNGNAEGPFGDGGSPTQASLAGPWSAVADSKGNFYIADYGHSCIRKVTGGTNPIITTVAGVCQPVVLHRHGLSRGNGAFSGDGGDAKNARLAYPGNLALDKDGNLYIADLENVRIRKVTLSTSHPTITTVVGNGTPGFAGDGSDPKNASVGRVGGLAFDSKGDLYFADSSNNRIRKVTFSSAYPIITTVVGNGTGGFSGDGYDPLQAQLSFPYDVAFDVADQLFIADSYNVRIRRVTFGANPVITTVAGNGLIGFSGDGGYPLLAEFQDYQGVAVDQKGYLYVADPDNQRVRMVMDMAARKTPIAVRVTLSFESLHLTYPGMTNVVVEVTGGPTPTGTVDLYDGATKLTTTHLQGNGKASWFISPGLSAGSHQISAAYSGDTSHAAGYAIPVAIQVDPVPVSLGISCGSASASTYQCTVNVSSNAGAALGSVTYSLDSHSPVSVPLSQGTAQLKLTPGIGRHTLALQYPQQGNFAASRVSTQNFITTK